jgi:hypothetical protein
MCLGVWKKEVCCRFAILEIFIFIWICLRSNGYVVECIGEVLIIIGVRILLILTVYLLHRSNSLHGVIDYEFQLVNRVMT